MRSLLAATLALAAMLVTPVFAAEYAAGNVRVDHVWARATPGATHNGAAYMTLTVTGDQGDRLIAASSPMAERAELHTHMMEGDVMKMRAVEAVDVAPGAPTALKPGGLHIMLLGLSAPLKEGERVPLTLTFERAGKLDVEIEVKALGATMEMDHGDHDMMDQGRQMDMDKSGHGNSSGMESDGGD